MEKLLDRSSSIDLRRLIVISRDALHRGKVNHHRVARHTPESEEEHAGEKEQHARDRVRPDDHRLAPHGVEEPPEDERAEEIANRTPCEDFEQFKPLFEAVRNDLKSGLRQTRAFHARTMDERGLTRHRFNACGYSVGARFSPSWMEHQMLHAGNTQEILPDMTLFVHMIIMDSDRETAMTLGHTYLTTETAPRALSRHPLELVTV